LRKAKLAGSWNHQANDAILRGVVNASHLAEIHLHYGQVITVSLGTAPYVKALPGVEIAEISTATV
jgi:hypothetical protein